MGGDPFFCLPKMLRLTFAGEAKCFMPEGGVVRYMAGKIKHAYYGAGNRQQQVHINGRYNVHATNDWLGCNPAFGEIKK